ncbi:hypothetical protein OIU77_026805 [Salix suchowensis]|uniref:Uncharacterized protein n=1 Tax=Salix suchowensis TaxID=1278906 RepID=A0ABQ9BMB9_9ROSI|nr:hypothetical protein OIU77_026805 [Salix suchowensis]
MGAFCCCLSSDEHEEHAYSGSSIHRHCFSLRFFFHQLLSGYGTRFHRLEGRTASPTQGGTFSASTGVGTGLPDSSTNDTHLSSSRPVPSDNDQSSGVESLGFGKKRNGVDSEDDNKLGFSESSEKSMATKVAYGLTYVQPSTEDEDVCPTCLDGNLMCLCCAAFQL